MTKAQALERFDFGQEINRIDDISDCFAQGIDEETAKKHGWNTQHRCENKSLRLPRDETMGLLSTALPRCRRRQRADSVEVTR